MQRYPCFSTLRLHTLDTMKKTITLLLFIVLVGGAGAQQMPEVPKIGLKWAPTGLTYGNISLLGEYNFGKNSLTAKIGIPSTAHQVYTYEGKDVNFAMKATSFLTGYRTYLSRNHMKGLYLEPYFKYVHHTSEGVGMGTLDTQPVRLNFTNDYNGLGIGAQLGAQFLIKKHFIIDLFFLGPEINSASNKFKAVEMTNSSSWNDIQASDAERDIRDFLNKFPFIRNNVNVMVDKSNRSITADFKGFLPGYRAGVSIGYAF